MEKVWIAERKLVAKAKKTGERKEITIRVGTPYWIPNDEFASCPLELDGLFDHVADAKGIDLLQALQQAANIDIVLEKLGEKYNFYWPTGEGYFDDD
jgi:hypothetical protein